MDELYYIVHLLNIYWKILFILFSGIFIIFSAPFLFIFSGEFEISGAYFNLIHFELDPKYQHSSA